MIEPEAYAVPDDIEAPLAEMRAHWKGLRRGGNEMPFWDDVKLSALQHMGDEVMLIDVFENPERFRFNFLGSAIVDRYGRPVAGRFLDEIEAQDPFDHFEAQCAEAVRSRAPTYYRHRSAETRPYARIVLPLWGNGHVEMLMVAVADTSGG